MDVGTDQFLRSWSALGYVAALGVFVVAVLFGTLVVRPWQSPPDRQRGPLRAPENPSE